MAWLTCRSWDIIVILFHTLTLIVNPLSMMNNFTRCTVCGDLAACFAWIQTISAVHDTRNWVESCFAQALWARYLSIGRRDTWNTLILGSTCTILTSIITFGTRRPKGVKITCQAGTGVCTIIPTMISNITWSASWRWTWGACQTRIVTILTQQRNPIVVKFFSCTLACIVGLYVSFMFQSFATQALVLLLPIACLAFGATSITKKICVIRVVANPTWCLTTD